jgi:hypothetical protein
MIMSVSDGGSPVAAQQNAGPTSPPSGTWTVTVRNAGTASLGTTQVQLNVDYNSSHLQPASGSSGRARDQGAPTGKEYIP